MARGILLRRDESRAPISEIPPIIFKSQTFYNANLQLADRRHRCSRQELFPAHRPRAADPAGSSLRPRFRLARFYKKPDF